MTFIKTISEEEATGPAAEIYEEDREGRGYVSNYSRLFAYRPAAYEAWGQLNGSIKAAMGLRRYELATLAAAARSFFSKVLDAMGANPDSAYRDMEPELQDLLTVGRPIAAG
jgi:hypothetical protein